MPSLDLLNVSFSISGVKTNIFLPPFVAMVISFFTSMGGISGAFLLLPFQMSVLNYTSPSVSGTNHVYNMVAIPSGVYRFIKEGRMAWPLTWTIVIGTLPGVFLGYYIRVLYLPDPKSFKLFVGCVLLYIGIRLIKDISGKIEDRFRTRFKTGQSKVSAVIPTDAMVKTISISLKKIEYEFCGERFSFNPVSMFFLAFVVGIIGGAYGIGGGAIIAPLCVAFFHLPVYTIAGATLMGTFITSFAGALFFTIIPVAGVSAVPDWSLGILFGIGGFLGMYLGARVQRFMPQRIIKVIVTCIIMFLSFEYIIQYF